MRPTIFILPLLALCIAADSNSTDVYDYIVVGSGPGGGPLASNLARAGHSVLLIEAGDDQSANINSQIAGLFPQAFTDPVLRWDFFALNSDNETRVLQHNHIVWRRPDGSFYVGREPPEGSTLLGLHYPRGKTLGGSSTVNAMAAVLPSDSDWQHVVDVTGDETWSPSHMRDIFARIEKNHHLPQGTPGHGLTGYLDTVQGDASIWNGHNDLVSVLQTISESLGQNGSDIQQNLVSDVNFLGSGRDRSQGVWGSTIHTNANLRRFSSRTYILDTFHAVDANGNRKFPLHLQLNTLATKVLFDTAPEKEPRATGIEYLLGANLYRADPLSSPSNGGSPGRAYARKEVILAGGAFNSPQLLQLSGLGPASELRRLNISILVDLPGVGHNLQDNYEFPIVGLAARNFTAPLSPPNTPNCAPGMEGDPCVALWRQGRGPYSIFAPYNAILRKSSAAQERDVFMMGGTSALRGFWPPTDSVPDDPPNTFALSTVKMHPRGTRGMVRLRSADPRDVVDVNFGWFRGGDGSRLDLEAELDTVKWARRVFASVPPPVGPITPVEPPCRRGKGVPETDGTCDDEDDREWIRTQVFGHHPTSTCAIGADEFAVLDSKFRVRGVAGLRVVDASAFPRPPGAFPVIPTFILSEKATESVLEDAAS